MKSDRTSAVGGRRVGQRLTAREAALYREWIANQRAIDRIVSRMQQISRSASQILLRQERSGSAAPEKAKRR